MPDSNRIVTGEFVLMGLVYAGIGVYERTFAGQFGYFTAAAICVVVACAIGIDSRREPRQY